MGVAVDATTAAVTNVNGVSPLTITNLTVGSGSNRAAAVLVWFASGTFPAGVTATWAGQSMTQVAGTQFASGGTSIAAAIYAVIAPTSGSNNLVISGWAGSLEAHACAISFTGVDQTSVAVAFPHGTTNTASSTGPSSVTVTSATGNLAVGAHAQGLSSFGAISGTTIAVDNVVGPALATAGNYDNGAATVTLTAAFTGTGPWVAVGCDVLAAAGGAASGSSMPSSRVMVPSLGPTRGLQAVRAFPGAIIASGTWSSTGAANDAVWTGQSVGPPLALPITQRILRPNIGPSRGLQQVKGFPPPAAAISSATWSSAGAANDAIWTGAAINAATWSAVGSGVANWTGAATGAGTWSSAGAANDAIWVGTGVLGGVWSATGVGAATWVGLGISIQSGVWNSSGTSDAPWIGASIFAGVWSASGVGSANWTSAATAASTWSSTGTGGASWTGAASAAGTWGSSGISDAPWVGAVPATQGALSSDGVGLAFWIGADATPSAAKPGGAGYVLHYTRKRHRERIEELERVAAALLAKAETSKAEQCNALIKAAVATETVAGILALLPAESIVEPALDKLVAASEAAIAARTRAAVVAQTTALIRYADLILEEAEEEEAEMLLFFN